MAAGISVSRVLSSAPPVAVAALAGVPSGLMVPGHNHEWRAGLCGVSLKRARLVIANDISRQPESPRDSPPGPLPPGSGKIVPRMTSPKTHTASRVIATAARTKG